MTPFGINLLYGFPQTRIAKRLRRRPTPPVRRPPKPKTAQPSWFFSVFSLGLNHFKEGVVLDPLKSCAPAHRKESAVSRVLSWATIPLGCASPRSSSDLPGSPCGPHVAAFRPPASLFGLAPGGVCRAVGVAASAVRSYRTISPLPAPLARRLGGIFLLHFPWTRVPQALPGTVPCGARTFLHPLPLARSKAAAARPTLSAQITLV